MNIERIENTQKESKGQKKVKTKHFHWNILFPHKLTVHHLPVSLYWPILKQVLKEILV